VGTITADYFEKTGAQWAELNGANGVLTYRATEALSFLDWAPNGGRSCFPATVPCIQRN